MHVGLCIEDAIFFNLLLFSENDGLLHKKTIVQETFNDAAVLIAFNGWTRIFSFIQARPTVHNYLSSFAIFH